MSFHSLFLLFLSYCLYFYNEMLGRTMEHTKEQEQNKLISSSLINARRLKNYSVQALYTILAP